MIPLRAPIGPNDAENASPLGDTIPCGDRPLPTMHHLIAIQRRAPVVPKVADNAPRRTHAMIR